MYTQSPPLYRVPGLFFGQEHLNAAESTRHGGVSPAPYASLNLGLNTADDEANVVENRNRFFAAVGVDPSRVASSHQVHGNRVLTVVEPGRYDGYDALMTGQPNLFVTVTVADCVPVLICDPVRRAVAAIHAGWRGTAAQIVRETLTAMHSAFGTRPADCLAYVGTSIDADAYEVGQEVASAFSESCCRYDRGRDRYFLDLKEANRAQLLAGGVPAEQVELSPYSTVRHADDYFSYRRESGQTGRMLALIGWRC